MSEQILDSAQIVTFHDAVSSEAVSLMPLAA